MIARVDIRLARLSGPSAADLRLLSAGERERVRSFTSDRDRDGWVGARALLRRTLARWVGADPADLVFAYGATGKPSLPGGPFFSLAHSAGWAIVAISGEAPVGADIELVRPQIARPPSADVFFGDRERAELEALAEPQRTRRFFQLWTLKEAYRKATGEGVGRGSLGELPPAGWAGWRPNPPAGYEAAVVVLAEAAEFRRSPP